MTGSDSNAAGPGRAAGPLPPVGVLTAVDLRRLCLQVFLYWLFASEIATAVIWLLDANHFAVLPGGDDPDVVHELVFSSCYLAAVVGLVALTLRRGGLDWEALGLGLPNQSQIIFGVAIGLLSVTFSILAFEVFDLVIAESGTAAAANETPEPPGAPDWAHLFVPIMSGMIAFPILEEIFFRGVLFGWLYSRYQAVNAYLANGFVFALYHLRFDLLDFADLMVAGMIFAWVYRRSGSLWAAIAAHGTHNFILDLVYDAYQIL